LQFLINITDFQVPIDLEFMTDTGTSPDLTEGRASVGVQHQTNVADVEVQTFYTGTLVSISRGHWQNLVFWWCFYVLF
jgi:hypothetical protein